MREYISGYARVYVIVYSVICALYPWFTVYPSGAVSEATRVYRKPQAKRHPTTGLYDAIARVDARLLVAVDCDQLGIRWKERHQCVMAPA